MKKKKKSNPKSSPIIKTKTINKPLTSSPPPSLNSKTRGAISDLKKTTSLHIDFCYSDLLEDMDASHIRLQKRFKAQSQACKQSMVEAEKDFKKMIVQMSELMRRWRHHIWMCLQKHKPELLDELSTGKRLFEPLEGQWMIKRSMA